MCSTPFASVPARLVGIVSISGIDFDQQLPGWPAFDLRKNSADLEGLPTSAKGIPIRPPPLAKFWFDFRYSAVEDQTR